MYLKHKIIVMIFSLLCLSCTVKTDTAELSKVNETAESNQVKKQWRNVKVMYIQLEGGFYGLLTDTGDKLLPTNLAKNYQIPGTLLRIKGQEVKGMMTMQQWGMLYEITDIEVVELGSLKANSSL